MLNSIKRLRLIYAIYNFFHPDKLRHNVALYKKYGLNKKYYSSISSMDFKKVALSTTISSDARLQLDLPKSHAFQQQSAANKTSLLSFYDNGFAILGDFFQSSEVDAINAEIDTLLQNKKVSFRYKNKIMFAFRQSALLRRVGENEKLLELLSILINRKAVLFQSINFLTGSEQKTHSDSIHMTTFPVGGLVAVWIALEDITEENGPLHYYPGSHKLPYYFNSDYDNAGTTWLIGDKPYTEYEKAIQRELQSKEFEKKVFLAKKGDVFIWHANLFHGGEPHLDKSKTRKSMVLHYFNEEDICYHEITQRPALIARK